MTAIELAEFIQSKGAHAGFLVIIFVGVFCLFFFNRPDTKVKLSDALISVFLASAFTLIVNEIVFNCN